MSMNKFMHPRNIYKTPPNFQQLAVEYSEFSQYVTIDICGKVVFDFKNPDSLRALSKTLMKRDFDLDVDIPDNKLVPTIPLRLNYILWLEDLLKFIGKESNITGIDIGTGASCVYPLIAAKKNKWKMTATEIDDTSFKCALHNVSHNNLDGLISVINVNKSDKLIEDIITLDTTIYDFCMCNPPFFSNTQELHPFFKARKNSRPYPKNAFVASVNEVVANGGEIDFLTKLINESKSLQTRITVYTTMVGHKSSMPVLKKLLRDIEVISFTESEFCQGNTTRWGLAWTFNTEFNLKKFVDCAKLAVKPKKTHEPFEYVLPITDIDDSLVDKTNDYLLTLFAKNLQMTCSEVTRNKRVKRYFVTAYANTWSHQRQKRRRQSHETGLNNNNQVETGSKSPGKRVHDEAFDGSMLKKLRIEDNAGKSYFLKIHFSLEVVDGTLVLSLNTVDEDTNREYLHQILQYIKNNFKPDSIVNTKNDP